MSSSLRHLLGWILSAFCSRQDLILENLALRQQLLARYTQSDRAVAFWAASSECCYRVAAGSK